MTISLDTWLVILVFSLACFLIGLSKGGLGGGLGGLVTPLMALVIPINHALGMMLPVLMIGDIFAVGAHWRGWNSKLLWALIGGGLVGVSLGMLLITNVSPFLLNRLLAILVFLFVFYRLLEKRFHRQMFYQSRSWHGFVAGAVAGFTSTLAHAGGPPLTIYLLMQNLSPPVFVATSAIFIAVLNFIKLPYYAAAGMMDFREYLYLAFFLPMIPFGVWAGKRLVNWIDKSLFEKIITIWLFISGLLLWLKA
ncbi:MAG TPA: sulfite exporter TauE/SafE family protein [Anaerolineales bacterium]|nr:sulfite exporter TauE/SafE family protein [Anaerolineales bacterium]